MRESLFKVLMMADGDEVSNRSSNLALLSAVNELELGEGSSDSIIFNDQNQDLPTLKDCIRNPELYGDLKLLIEGAVELYNSESIAQEEMLERKQIFDSLSSSLEKEKSGLENDLKDSLLHVRNLDAFNSQEQQNYNANDIEASMKEKLSQFNNKLSIIGKLAELIDIYVDKNLEKTNEIEANNTKIEDNDTGVAEQDIDNDTGVVEQDIHNEIGELINNEIGERIKSGELIETYIDENPEKANAIEANNAKIEDNDTEVVEQDTNKEKKAPVNKQDTEKKSEQMSFKKVISSFIKEIKAMLFTKEKIMSLANPSFEPGEVSTEQKEDVTKTQVANAEMTRESVDRVFGKEGKKKEEVGFQNPNFDRESTNNTKESFVEKETAKRQTTQTQRGIVGPGA